MTKPDLPTGPDFDKLGYLASVIENITDVITILDAVGNIRYESPSITAVLGYTPEELIGKNAFSLIHPEDYKDVTALFMKSIAQRDKVELAEFRYKHKDGSWRHMESSAKNLLFDPHVRGVVISSRDISSRRKTENQIRLQSHALQAAANGIVITDIAGTIQWVNEAFTCMTGYAFEEAVGKNPRILKSGEQKIETYEDLWKTILAGDAWTGELINRRKDGSLYFEQQNITPVKNNDGDITHFIAIKQDISEEKKIEAQFRQAQKMEAVGRLAGGVAHDFNNLLTIILWQSDILMAPLDKNDPRRSTLMDIKNAGQRAAGLTRQLLAFSRRQVFQMKVTDLNEIVKGVDKMIRRLVGEDIEIISLLAENLPPIKVDAAQIEQVIMNLAVNARDAMPGGGKINLETKPVEIDPKTAAVLYSGMPPGKYIQLKFSDTGAGISPEARAHLFEPFFTTKEKGKGTGLGLATCYGIVKQSKGFIYAECEPGRGASFLIFFPPEEEVVTGLPVPKTTEMLPCGIETVLIAEDEPLVRSLAVQVLTRQGYQVLESENGEEALRVAEKLNPGSIHMLLTDMVMPYMGGNELAEKFSPRFPNAKILFSSGYTDHSAVQKWLDKGHRFLQKPYTPSELVLTVREVLDGVPEKK